jgi:hypothetical protein
MGIFNRKSSSTQNDETQEENILNLNRPLGFVQGGAWKNLSVDEKTNRYLLVADGIKHLNEYDSLVTETAKNWSGRQHFADRHWGKWMLALLVDGMFLSEVLRAAEAGLLEASYEPEELSSMAQLYFYRLQNLDAVREMLVVDMYYRVLQNTPNLDELSSIWERFANY